MPMTSRERVEAALRHQEPDRTPVFEYVLLRSGRIILFPASEREAIVLENVLNVNALERHVHELLSSLAVEIETPPGQNG